MAKISLSIDDFKGLRTDVSKILEVDKKGLMTRGYQKLSDLYPKGFIFLEVEPYLPYVGGRQSTEAKGFDIKCLNVSTSESFSIRVSDDLPDELESMSKVDFENVLVKERIKTSGSGTYASNELIRDMMGTRLIKVNAKQNISTSNQPNQDKK